MGENRRNEKMKQWMQCCLIMALSFYVALDLSIHYGTRRNWATTTREVKFGNKEGESGCEGREGHYEGQTAEGRAWKQMKWTGEPASCRVKGHLIEKLDAVNDFRRGYALKFTADVEDKTHLLPWLLASRTGELAARRRRVYLDLGASSFNSSVQWFLRMYPCDFTEVHAFEILPSRWNPPDNDFDEDANLLPADAPRPDAIRVHSTPSIPQWMMERVKVHYQMVSHKDDPSTNSVDISRFIKEELRLTPADTVVVKMDIEGGEWPILREWLKDPEMPLIVDELFVEVHYASPTLSVFGCDNYAPHSREDACWLMADLRCYGFYAHSWP